MRGLFLVAVLLALDDGDEYTPPRPHHCRYIEDNINANSVQNAFEFRRFANGHLKVSLTDRGSRLVGEILQIFLAVPDFLNSFVDGHHLAGCLK